MLHLRGCGHRNQFSVPGIWQGSSLYDNLHHPPTVGAVTPCVVKATTTVNGEAVTAAQLAERSFLVGRDQKVVDGTLTESSFVIAEGGLILE